MKLTTLIAAIAAATVVFVSLSSCNVGPVAMAGSTDGVIANTRALEAPADPLAGLPRMTGVNWFGFETQNYLPHGLWARDYRSMLKQMKDLGFNAIRLPWSNEMLDKSPSTGLQINAWGADPYTKVVGINTDLAGLTSLQIMDKIIAEAGRLGMMIVIDNHSRAADGYYNQTLWYTKTVSEDKWVADWIFMVKHFKSFSNVVACDLNNEPHGGLLGQGMKPPASWGYDVPGYGITDWKKAAVRAGKAILAENPDMRIVIQGVQEAQDGTNAWWGSSHKDLKNYPLTELPRNRVIYSVHEYGPEVHDQDWLSAPDFPSNLPSVWRERFWFIYEQSLGGLYVGEMGIKEATAGDPKSIPYIWFKNFLEFAGSKVHWTYWSWNPNSGDTGGILQDDWLTVNPKKYAMIKPYLAGNVGPTIIPTVTPTVTPTITPTATPTVTPTSTPTVVPTVTPTVIPTVTPTGIPTTAFRLEYINANPDATSNSISYRLRITANTSIALSNVTASYVYTTDGTGNQSITIDHAGIQGTSGYRDITTMVTGLVDTSTTNARGTIQFTATAGILALGNSVEIQVRITNANWQNYNQLNDPSFKVQAAFGANKAIELKYKGVLVNGSGF